MALPIRKAGKMQKLKFKCVTKSGKVWKFYDVKDVFKTLNWNNIKQSTLKKIKKDKTIDIYGVKVHHIRESPWIRSVSCVGKLSGRYIRQRRRLEKLMGLTDEDRFTRQRWGRYKNHLSEIKQLNQLYGRAIHALKGDYLNLSHCHLCGTLMEKSYFKLYHHCNPNIVGHVSKIGVDGNARKNW